MSERPSPKAWARRTAPAGLALAGVAALAWTPATAPGQGQSGPRQTVPGWAGTPPPQPGQASSPSGGLVAVVPGRVV